MAGGWARDGAVRADSRRPFSDELRRPKGAACPCRRRLTNCARLRETDPRGAARGLAGCKAVHRLPVERQGADAAARRGNHRRGSKDAKRSRGACPDACAVGGLCPRGELCSRAPRDICAKRSGGDQPSIGFQPRRSLPEIMNAPCSQFRVRA